MRLVTLALSIIASSLGIATGNQLCGCNNGTVLTHEWHEHIVNNYLNLWRGDIPLLDQTISPQFSFYGDRFPSSTGVGSTQLQLNSSATFGGFVASSRIGFTKYGFDPIYWFGQDNKVAIRWALNAIFNSSTRLPATLPPGSPLTYNGTDTLILNQCTGLVDEVDSAQDLITFFHNLGLTSITV